MTKSELMESLKDMPDDAIVYILDENSHDIDKCAPDGFISQAVIRLNCDHREPWPNPDLFSRLRSVQLFRESQTMPSFAVLLK